MLNLFFFFLNNFACEKCLLGGMVLVCKDTSQQTTCALHNNSKDKQKQEQIRPLQQQREGDGLRRDGEGNCVGE